MSPFDKFLNEWRTKLAWAPYCEKAEELQALEDEVKREFEELRNWRIRGIMTDEDEMEKLERDAEEE